MEAPNSYAGPTQSGHVSEFSPTSHMPLPQRAEAEALGCCTFQVWYVCSSPCPSPLMTMLRVSRPTCDCIAMLRDPYVSSAE